MRHLFCVTLATLAATAAAAGSSQSENRAAVGGGFPAARAWQGYAAQLSPRPETDHR